MFALLRKRLETIPAQTLHQGELDPPDRTLSSFSAVAPIRGKSHQVMDGTLAYDQALGSVWASAPHWLYLLKLLSAKRELPK